MIRKLALGLAVALATLTTAAACPGQRVCEPGAIREDQTTNRENVFEVCKPDGSGWVEQENPEKPKNPIDA